jgi:hypothetical protein
LEAGRQATPRHSGRPDRFRLPGGNDALSVSGRDGLARGRSDVPFDRGRGSLERGTPADRVFTPGRSSSPGNNFGSGHGKPSNRSSGFRGPTVVELPGSRGRSSQVLPPSQQRNSGDPLGRSGGSGFQSSPPNIRHSFQPGPSFSPRSSSPPTINRGRGNFGGFPGMGNRGGDGGRGRGNGGGGGRGNGGGGGRGGPPGKGRGK